MAAAAFLIGFILLQYRAVRVTLFLLLAWAVLGPGISLLAFATGVATQAFILWGRSGEERPPVEAAG